MKPLNRVVSSTPPSAIRRFFDVASQMEDVISLGVGEPDFVTPWRVRESGIWALERGYTTYTPNAGLPEVRRLVCEHLMRWYGVGYAPDGEVLLTVGVSQGLDLALRSILNPGDEVIYLEPGYVSYEPGIRFAGGEPVPVSSSASDGFRVRPEEVAAAITTRTKAILLCNPNNPTGAVQSAADLQAIVDLAAQRDLYLVSDEIYDRLTYVGAHTCLPSLPGARERTVLLNGFSKAYAMTGWRLGYACAPRAVCEAMLKVHQYTMLCAPHAAQMAAAEGLREGDEDVERMVADYDRRRRLFVSGLNAAGLDCPEPAGAFYAFPSVRRSGMSSEEFSDSLLREEHVAVIPGSAFGPSGEGHVRCSYAAGIDQLEEALRRISRFMEKHGGSSRKGGPHP